MSVMQKWTNDISCMQQTVLITAIRGPDGVPKYHASKYLIRWFRRCILINSFTGKIIQSPFDDPGGSFTGPSFLMHGPTACDENGTSLPQKYQSKHIDDWETPMQYVFDNYLKSLDELQHHFQLHFMHAIEIVGYKHPDKRKRNWWNYVYNELARDMHLNPETEEQLDYRLGDKIDQWRDMSSEATQD